MVAAVLFLKCLVTTAWLCTTFAPAGPDMFFARVGKDAVVKTALLPALTVGVKKAGGEVPG